MDDNTNNTAKICFSYIRFSSRIQAKGDSESRQLEIAPRIAKAKGWILRDDLCAKNLGFSAYKGDNLKTIEGIIESAKSGKIPQGSVMIIEAFDRLTRIKVDDAYELFRRLLKAGIEIYTERSDRHITVKDLDNMTSLMLTVVELDASFQYSDKLSYRCGSAWKKLKARAADGIVFTKMCPGWLDADKKNNKFTLNGHAKTIVRIFEQYANGKGIRTIMRELNKEGIPPLGRGRQNKSGSWSSSHMRRILLSRSVLGEYQPCRYVGRKRVEDGLPIADYYPAVVDKSLFYTVQNRLTGKERKGYTSGPKANATNLFTGIAKCAHCGAPMHIKDGGLKHGKYSYVNLICANAKNGMGCQYHTIRNEFVERAVLTLLFTKVIPAMTESDTRQETLIALNGELNETQKQIKKWLEVIEESETAPKSAGQKLNALETAESVLKRKIESLSATINDNPLAAWKHVPNTPENRLRLQGILADEIESLTIDAGNRIATLTIKDPHCSFVISWDKAKGSNATKKARANTSFNCAGFDKEFQYLDHVLVWESEYNMSFEDFFSLVTFDKPVKLIGGKKSTETRKERCQRLKPQLQKIFSRR